LDEDQSILVIEEARPEGKKKSSCVAQPSWPNLMLLVEGELFAQKQILGNQRAAGSHQRPQNPNHVSKERQ
jgi:hypothetical protein